MKLEELIKLGCKVLDDGSIRKLKDNVSVKSLRLSSRGRLSIPKSVMQMNDLYRFEFYLPLHLETSNEIYVYFLDQKELDERKDLRSGIKKILYYNPKSRGLGENKSTTYIELGPQLKRLGLLSEERKNGFMVDFEVKESKVLILKF